MAIFNESYTNDILEGGIVNEGFGQAISAMKDVLKSLRARSMVKFVDDAFKQVKEQAEIIKKALKVFPEMHEDCIPLSDFKEKLFTISPYSDEPDEEYDPSKDEEKKNLDKQIGKMFKGLKIDTTYPNKCVCYFDDSDTMVMYYCYRVTGSGDYTSYKITSFFKDSKVEKYKEYYISHFMSDRSMMTNDCLTWAKKTLKEYESFKEKKEE